MSSIPDPDSVKMFVGQIPRSMEEDELKEIMEEYGKVYQLGIIRDRASGHHRGCAFVTFYKRKDAMAAQAGVHGVKTLPGMNYPMQMKPAEGTNTNVEDRKLFVGMLPKSFTESDIAELFAPFGTIEDCSVLKEASGQSKGCAFVVFSTRLCAQNAVRTMHHSRVLDGCKSPMVVKFADTQRDKEMKRLQTQRITNMHNDAGPGLLGMQSPPPMFGQQIPPMPMQNMPHQQPNPAAVNSLAALASLGSMGMNQQQLQQILTVAAVVAPMIQNSQGAANQVPAPAVNPQPVVNQQNAGLNNLLSSLIGGGNLGNTAASADRDMGSSSAALQQWAAAGMVNQPPNTAFSNTGGAGSVQSYSAYGAPLSNSQSIGADFSQSGTASGAELLSKAFSGIQQFAASFPNAYSLQGATGGATFSSAAGSQLEGPEGANLFIYNLPEEFRDNDILQIFMPFGTVISAKVFVDKLTGHSKCFGFVSFESPSAAQTAIQSMNGFQIGSRRLKVQLKRPKSNGKPY